MQNIEHQLGPYRVVDLSTHLVPSQSRRNCQVQRYLQQATQDYHSTLTLSSHAGTHVETPLHYGIERSILDLPPTAFMGRAVMVMCFSEDSGRVHVHSEHAHGLCPGDIAILVSEEMSEPFADLPHDNRPQLTHELAKFLAGKGVKAIALGNSMAIEKDNDESLKIHHELLHRDVLLIENLRNLESLRARVFLLIAMPLPIAGLDSCPVYALGVEGVPGFTEEATS